VRVGKSEIFKGVRFHRVVNNETI